MARDQMESEMELISDIFKVMGDVNRLHILLLLSDQELCVCEITSILKITQSNASQHLAKLRSARLVKERRNAQWIYYSLNPDTFPMIRDMLKTLSKEASHTIASQRPGTLCLRNNFNP